MKIPALMAAATLVGLLSVGTVTAGTITVDTGPSSQTFTLYGQGEIAPGIGSFKIGQGSSTYDSVTNTSTFTLSGTITGGSAGYNSGNYSFVTTYSDPDTPEAGLDAPFAQSNPGNTNEFFYDSLDPSTTMTLFLTGTPTGNHAIPLVAGGNFVANTGFGFGFTSASCSPLPTDVSCGQNNVGLNSGTSIFGPVDISASFAAVPESATWAMLLVGVLGAGAALRASRGERALA